VIKIELLMLLGTVRQTKRFEVRVPWGKRDTGELGEVSSRRSWADEIHEMNAYDGDNNGPWGNIKRMNFSDSSDEEVEGGLWEVETGGGNGNPRKRNRLSALRGSGG
jgi:hypothetical protein